jgi:hypothetical protein
LVPPLGPGEPGAQGSREGNVKGAGTDAFAFTTEERGGLKTVPDTKGAGNRTRLVGPQKWCEVRTRARPGISGYLGTVCGWNFRQIENAVEDADAVEALVVVSAADSGERVYDIHETTVIGM